MNGDFMSIELQLKRAYNTGKVLLGLKITEKKLLISEPKAVVFSKDLDSISKERLLNELNISKIPYYESELNQIELGEVLGVDFSVSTTVIIDEGKTKIIEEIQKRNKQK